MINRQNIYIFTFYYSAHAEQTDITKLFHDIINGVHQFLGNSVKNNVTW